MNPEFIRLTERLLFGVLFTVPSLVVLCRALPKTIAMASDAAFNRWYFAVYALGRVGLFVLVFLVAHQKPHGDVTGYYMDPAHAVMRGELPYRDFPMSYAPLYGYLDGLLLKLHDSAITLVVFAVVCDIAAVPVWLNVVRRQVNEVTVRKAALLFLLQPMLLWDVVIDGTNGSLIALLMAIGLYFLLRRDAVSGFFSTLSIVLVKFLPLLFVPSLIVAARKRVSWIVGAAVLPVVVYGGCLLMKLDITVPLKSEGARLTSADLPYFFGMLTGMNVPERVWDALTLLMLLVVLVIALRSQWSARTDAERMWKLSLAMILVLTTVLDFSKKSYPTYFAFFFILLCAFFVSVYEKHKWSCAACYGLVSATFLWGTAFELYPIRSVSAVTLHARMMSGNHNAIVMFLIQALFMFCYGWMIVMLLRQMLSTKTPVTA